MKVPDKIYLLSTPYRILDGWYNSEIPVPNNFQQTEYLRKDALLEWAKNEQKKSTTILADDWWQEVINKINSL